ncbi:unnamed protein product [Paramecium sonneborni]|uniref:Uncharacterized protein n=1 Tax=Paramecium sonneborni TaxID=65129 RepID=A0A8S1R9C2_9CILI|nr:unnamed protein product [Paramecium sonneborni]
MQKLLFTEEGLQIMRSRNSDPIKQNSENKGISIRPKCLRIQSLSRQCNRVRVGTLKNTFNLSSPENLLQVLPFTRQKHKATSIPQVLSVDQLQGRQQEDLLQMAASHLHLPNRSVKDGIGRHHLQSIRLRTGDWFQWKNIPMLASVVDDFQKKLKLQQTSEEEEHMKAEKRLIQHEFEMKKLEQIQKRTAQNLNQVLEQKSLTYNIDLDEFWKQMKENSKYFQHHTEEMAKSKASKQERLEKFQKKFGDKKAFIPQIQKQNVNNKETAYYDI